MAKQTTVIAFIQKMIEFENGGGKITLEEWTDIRHNGTEEEIAAAVDRMMATGGYENLE